MQIKIIPISGDKHLDYATEIFKTLKENDVRVELDESNESLSKKIRNAKVQKIPYLIIIGDREKGSKKLTVEGRNDKKFENISTEEFLTKLKKEIEEKSS